MSDDQAAGWTDVHIHAVPQDFRPSATTAVDFLRELGVDQLLVCVVRSVPDIWDAEEEPPAPIIEEEDVDLERYAELLGRADAEHVFALVDPADCGLADLCVELDRGSKGDWQPCAVSLGIGTTTIPNLDCSGTMATFACSLAIGGPGIPRNAERAALAVPRLKAITALTAQVQAGLGERCVAHMTFAPDLDEEPA